MAETCLDYIDKIMIPLMESSNSGIDTLKYLGEGILFLANLIRGIEEDFKKRNPILNKATLFSSSGNNKFLPNVFNWFSISATSYCRTVKFLELQINNNWNTAEVVKNNRRTKDECEEYIKKVIPEIYVWRNKIAAHYAITDPKTEGENKDNEATLEYSLLTPVTWRKDHFCVGTLNLEKGNETSSIPEWSVIGILEEKLIPRYWPKKN